MPVQTKSELINQLILHKSSLISYGVISIGVFGSFVRDEATDKSDVDFLIDLLPEYKTLKNLSALNRFLQSLTKRKVEIITPLSLNKFTGKYILNEVEYVSLAA